MATSSKAPSITATNDAPVASSTSATPSNPLTNTAGNNFLLFNGYWLDLQSFVSSTLTLPITQGNFTDKYGTFTDMNDVENCITNLKAINALSTVMGDPNQLQAKIAQNPSYVSGTTAPVEIYAQCIWLAGQINVTASTYTETYANFQAMFTGNPTTDAATVRAILTGPGGMQSNAQTMLGYVQTLQANLSDFQTKFATATAAVNAYFNEEATVLTDAQAAITTDQNNITTLQAQAADAYKEWKDYTIAATTTSIGLMILSGGLLLPVAAGLGIGLGVEAAKELALYNTYMGEIADDNADLLKKKQLVIDLSPFNSSVANVNTLCTLFAQDLAYIEGVWMNQNTAFTAIANLDDDKIGTYANVIKIMDLLAAQKSWQTIAQNTQIFTTNCLVNYLSTVQFPAPVPPGAATPTPSTN